MPKISRNKLIDQAHTITCLHLHFEDYQYVKSKLKAGEKFVERATGKIIPNPSQLTNALAKKLTCAYSIEANVKGYVQTILIADVNQAVAFAGALNLQGPKSSTHKPCSRMFVGRISMDRHYELAKRLQLI